MGDAKQTSHEIIWYAAKVGAAFAAFAAVLYLASDVLLLVFAAILTGIFLAGLAHWLREKTPLGHGWSLAAVILTILSILTLGGMLAFPSISEQLSVLSEKLPQSISQLEQQVRQYAWAEKILERAPSNPLKGESRQLLSGARGALAGLLGFIGSILIIFFVGLYLAAEPATYRRGLLMLTPPHRRRQIADLLTELNETLKWWLIGKFASMALIGVLTTAGLWLMGIPLALALGFIAALLTFIPNLGPILSALPAILLGLMEGPQQALYIALLYLGIQTVESYLITPLIQKRTVSLPPGLTISVQVLLGVLFGFMGLALATPFAAAGIVVIKKLYVKDTLQTEP